MIDISQNPRVSQLLGRIEEVRRAVAKLERTNAERREFEREVESWYLEIGRYVHWLLRQEPEALARVEAEAKLWAAELDARIAQRKGAVRQRLGGADDEEGWSVDLAAADAPSVDDGSVVELATDSAEQGIDRRDLGEGTRSVSVSLIMGDELPELEAEPLDEGPLAEIEVGALEPLGEDDMEAMPTHPTADPRPPARPVGPSVSPRPSPIADPVPAAARVRAPEAVPVSPSAAIAGKAPAPATTPLAQRVPPPAAVPPVRAASAAKPTTPVAVPPGAPAPADRPGGPAAADRPGAPAPADRPGGPAAANRPGAPAPSAPAPRAPAAASSPAPGSPRGPAPAAPAAASPAGAATPVARRDSPDEAPHPIEPLDLKPTLSDIDIEALTDSVVPAATTPVDHAWLGALRDLTEVVGAPEKGTLAEADCLAAANRLLNATTNMNVRWMGFPDGVQQALVGCIASRARNLQLRMAVDVEVRLTLGRLRRFHKARKLPALVALDEDGRPEGKSWEHDAHRWWAQLKAGG